MPSVLLSNLLHVVHKYLSLEHVDALSIVQSVVRHDAVFSEPESIHNGNPRAVEGRPDAVVVVEDAGSQLGR